MVLFLLCAVTIILSRLCMCMLVLLRASACVFLFLLPSLSKSLCVVVFLPPIWEILERGSLSHAPGVTLFAKVHWTTFVLIFSRRLSRGVSFYLVTSRLSLLNLLCNTLFSRFCWEETEQGFPFFSLLRQNYLTLLVFDKDIAVLKWNLYLDSISSSQSFRFFPISLENSAWLTVFYSAPYLAPLSLQLSFLEKDDTLCFPRG